MKLYDLIHDCNLLYIKIALIVGDSFKRISYSANITCLKLNYLKLI